MMTLLSSGIFSAFCGVLLQNFLILWIGNLRTYQNLIAYQQVQFSLIYLAGHVSTIDFYQRA